MHHLTQVSAASYSTFALPAVLADLYQCDSLSELAQLDLPHCPYVLGEGSNTIFLQDMAQPVLRYLAAEKQVRRADDGSILLHIDAGYNWHQLVQWTVAQGWWGLENLALIPGSVGAAPVQNIGAYGVELADCCDYVDFFDWQQKSVRRLNKADCRFGYRDSIFKTELAGRGLIVAVGLKLQSQGRAVTGYKGLELLTAESSVSQVMQAVIAVRQSKLPDPAQLANCGSFFKNPVLSPQDFARLKQQYPAVPAYPQADGQVKVAAGWLMEQAGFKGKGIGDIACYEKQALVLVNRGRGTATELTQLVSVIQHQVQQQFAVWLEPEVRLMGL
ncbi:UDP-N-acetylmuramate dehydrogenase [Rheinheimera sp.]|uniref:UDP-N-acetylmuramate dehydrogenase n=1 Tax=Rheinheimera sp. TaxID=1869214 RepID=UPI00307EDF12